MLIDKNNIPLVAMEFMNDTHKEDVDIINDLHTLILKYESHPTTINEELLNSKYQEWMIHTLEHFSTEEKKMIELSFPPYAMHKGEHDKELAKMDTLFRQWQSSKNIEVLKNYIEKELPQWLTNHIQTMDTATAMFFLTKKSPCSIA